MNRITEWNHIHKKSPERAKASLNLMLFPFLGTRETAARLRCCCYPSRYNTRKREATLLAMRLSFSLPLNIVQLG